jgi:hypothetical protein
MIYKMKVEKTMVIEAPTEEEALEKFFDRFDLDADEVKVICLGEGVKNEYSSDR